MSFLVPEGSGRRGQTATQCSRPPGPVIVLRDIEGIPHIIASNEHDMVMMQGWVHARDRLFQMDFLRRQASGTLAEMLGVSALESDVEFRTIGLRRSAERKKVTAAVTSIRVRMEFINGYEIKRRKR